MMNNLYIEGKEVKVTNLDKVFWPELGLTKADLIKYYIQVAPILLAHIRGRPFSMKPYPDGISGKSFYQKECPKEAPAWLQTTPIASDRKGVVNWCIINDTPSLIWIVNRACIEMHTWFARLPYLKHPDIAVLDIDPSGNTGFTEAVKVAKLFKALLDELNLHGFPKTSGMSGIHIYIPIKPVYSFSQVREFLLKLCQIIESYESGLATTVRSIKRRGDKVYLDAVQNASGKTIPAPYSLRPSPEATVSTPILWKELEDPALVPTKFTIQTIFPRLEMYGDLFQGVLDKQQKLPALTL
ncbi:MAG: non-homologous end-joining DNA ligase [Bacillota bacterium]